MLKSSEEKEIYKGYYSSSRKLNLLRYLWYAKEFFYHTKGKKILEIGCGDGGIVQILKAKNQVIAVDISQNAIKNLEEKGIKSYLIDISEEKLPFNSEEFDIILALEVLEHLKSPQNAIEEIQRVLKKDGRFIVSIPNPRTGHKLLYPSMFKFKNFKEYLKNNKFSIVKTTTYGVLPPFWNSLKKFISKIDNKNKKRLREKNKPEITLFSKIARIMSSKYLNLIKPKYFGFNFVYEVKNTNPLGAKELFKEIAEETKGAYN
jgi:ubiquinone/menaquinone biosynthesis C-methylase UbiE